LLAAVAGLDFDGTDLGFTSFASVSVSQSPKSSYLDDVLAGDWIACYTASLMPWAAVGCKVLCSLGDRIGQLGAMG
jgi:hypothetical protein